MACREVQSDKDKLEAASATGGRHGWSCRSASSHSDLLIPEVAGNDGSGKEEEVEMEVQVEEIPGHCRETERQSLGEATALTRLIALTRDTSNNSSNKTAAAATIT